MTTNRRSFLTATGMAAAGLIATQGAKAAAETSDMSAAPATPDHAGAGPHDMPTGLTLLSIRHPDGSETLGIRTANGVVDVKRAAALTHIAAPLTLDALLQNGGSAALHKIVAATGNSAKGALISESQIRYGRLFTRPGKIVCVGLNYRQHAKEVKMAIPRVPALFNKFNNTLAPHNVEIKLPPKDVAYKFDYETELLIVIGKHARNVAEADALNYVAGYCTANDFSARDLQLETGGQWMVGKTLDDFAPIGPYFVSADQVGDPNNLKIETHVNGEVRQSSNTSDFIFNTQQMIAYISRHWALEPGDIIFTGTPQGVILGYPKEKQVWLKPGDEIVSSIEKLGSLKFKLA